MKSTLRSGGFQSQWRPYGHTHTHTHAHTRTHTRSTHTGERPPLNQRPYSRCHMCRGFMDLIVFLVSMKGSERRYEHIFILCSCEEDRQPPQCSKSGDKSSPERRELTLGFRKLNLFLEASASVIKDYFFFLFFLLFDFIILYQVSLFSSQCFR